MTALWNRDEFDFFIDDKNGKSGSKRRGRKSNILKTGFSVCKCKRKARFFITRCCHNCCGRCLKRATAVVRFENHESTEVLFCPICKNEEREVLSWVVQKDVLDQLFQRDICICCFQIKTFRVAKCNHGICCLCIRQLLENPNTEQYQCPWNGCDVTYDLTSLSEMYTDTLAEMSQELFRRPYASNSSCCRNMAVLTLKTCGHILCMNCADKAPLVDNISENEENLQKCPLQNCSTKFPKECLEYYMQQLKSNMQMTTLFMKPVRMEPQLPRRCVMCNKISYEELVKLKLCFHEVCHPCLKKIVAANTSRELTNLDVTSTESLTCPKADCYTKLPIICVEAMNLALEGNLIAVAMFLRSTRKAYSRRCSKCYEMESYVEIISCSHYLCRQCVVKQISKATDSKIAGCILTSCCGIPVQCLKDVISKPIEEILKNNVDYFTELTRRVGVTEKRDDQQNNSSACGTSFSSATEKLKPSSTRGQSFDLLRPFFGEKINCNSCNNKAVIVFETCSHGWCVECLQKHIATSKDEKLHCKDCPSYGNIRNATRFLKKCRTEGLLEDTLNASDADEVTASSSIAGVDNVGKQASVGKTGVESMNFTFKELDFDKYGVRAKGLPNLGLTCYRNSVYQILAESPNFFSKLQHSTLCTDEDWTFTLCEILWRILSKSSSKGITEWLYRLQREFSVIDDSFQEYGQNDSLSFLTSLLNGITEEIQRKRKILNQMSIEDPADIFRGEMHDKYTCLNCKKEEYAGLSYFFSLPLPTINAKTPKIGQCLYQFFEAETLKGVVNCIHCKHDNVSKETVIKTFPSILVLQLGMISEQQENFTRVQKSPKFWENFKGLTNNIHLSKINMTEFSKYTLFGVIVHIGGLLGGHYYSYVKRLEDEKWDLCDDSYVKRVDLANVLCRDAYILFYHKCKRDTEC